MVGASGSGLFVAWAVDFRVGLVTSRAEPSFENFELGLLIYE